ncbi:hypothetical protein [Cohnella zeiphila]|uniref:Exodeoxyribonuclease X-like C-terminal domain-containing protein n=1 Tax=Cohnella zeiphila TaxID=2761120 RepID=A0A7X0SQR1_9BACL|nr:hypothetical protein [Cohnella zeiphila]MBB6734397.1 hypothetical protein [Cohnella zeiphila]
MEMTFGKYKGKTVEEVFQMNPGYFKWMEENGLTEKKSMIILFMRSLMNILNCLSGKLIFDQDINAGNVLHICPHCGTHQGDYHIVEDNSQPTRLESRFIIAYNIKTQTWSPEQANI